MTNRREFLQISIASSALALISKTSAAASSLSATGEVMPGYYKIIYDKRFRESVAFATHLAGRGLDVHGMEKGDITPFWFRELDPVWKQSPVPLMGMTAKGPLFCLEQLAAQHGMRVIFRAEHHMGEGSTRHELKGPDSLLEACLQQNYSQADQWPATVAELMLSCPAGKIAMAEAELETPAVDALDNHQKNNRGSLVSWIIAPARIRRQV